MLRIGEISYLNCTPIFMALRDHFPANGYEFIPGVPANLNALLREGDIDICPSSSIEYARNPDSYLILPDLSISADGPVKSVLLFSRRSLEDLDGASIALTSESATSVALLRIILLRKFGFTNTFTTVLDSLESSLSLHDAVLFIGDTALREAEKDTGCHIYDLGQLWRDFTGLPFVFALWLVRKAAFDHSALEVKNLHGRLLQSKRLALENLDHIAELLEKNDWTSRSFLINYWRTLSYDLFPRHIEGLRLFFHYAAGCDILEREPSLRMLG